MATQFPISWHRFYQELSDRVKYWNRTYYEGMINPLIEDRNEMLENVRTKTRAEELDMCEIRPNPFEKGDMTKVDTVKLSSLAVNENHNPEAQKAITCFMQHFFQDDMFGWKRWKIDILFNSFRRIGTESSYGQVFAVESDVNIPFVVKIATAQDGKDTLYREIIVSNLINRLRNLTPGFVYLYGHYNCSHGITDQGKNLVGYCMEETTNEKYLLYENITPSISFDDLIGSMDSFPHIITCLIQILLSLWIAWNEYKFSHNDLTYSNVMIKDLGSYHTVTYRVGAVNYNVVTQYVPVIIDYGLSSIQYMGHSYGPSEHQKWGMYAEHVYPAYDCFKIIMSTLYKMYTSGDGQKIGFARVLVRRFFSDTISPQFATPESTTIFGSVNSILTYVWNNFNSVSYGEDLLRLTHLDFINVMLPVVTGIDVLFYTGDVRDGATYPKYGCSALMPCKSFSESVGLMITPGRMPMSISDLIYLWEWEQHAGLRKTAIMLSQLINLIARDKRQLRIVYDSINGIISARRTEYSFSQYDMEEFATLLQYFNKFENIVDSINSLVEADRDGTYSSRTELRKLHEMATVAVNDIWEDKVIRERSTVYGREEEITRLGIRSHRRIFKRNYQSLPLLEREGDRNSTQKSNMKILYSLCK